MTKPVVIKFDGQNIGLKKALAEAEASLAQYDAAIKRSSLASERLAASNERWQKGILTGAKVAGVGALGLATALGAAATRAVSFDASMRNVNSIAGLSQKQFKALEAQVLRLAPAVGSSTTSLSEGLYDIVSTGFKANDAIKVLTVSAKAGKAGLTDTATATDAITSALKAYGQGAGQARQVSDLMFQTVNVGKLNFDQLAKSIGTVLPTAASLGIPLKELGAAMATITLNGTNANEASTQLSGIFTAFQKPTKDLTAVFKAQGYETATAGLKALGLKGSLDLLRRQVAGGHGTWTDFFKDVRALRGAQGLEGTATAVKLFNSSTKAMDDAVKGAGATQKAFNEQSKSTSVQFDKLKASIDVAAVTIGTALLPEINKGIHALSAWLTEAQRSGELQHFAQTIATDVEATVKWLEGLGPAAEKGLHVVTATIAAAVPYAKALEHVIEAIAPELEAVAHAGSSVASALGPGAILGSVGAYLALHRAVLTTQVGMGKYAAVMKAGAEATAIAGGGAVTARGRIDAVGKAAINAESKTKIFARGLVGSIGKGNLVAAGAAGIVGAILLIRDSLSDTEQEARDAVRALKDVFDAQLALKDAKLDVRQAQLNVDKTQAALPGAAVRVANARANLLATQGHPGTVDPAAEARYTQTLRDQKQAIIDAQRAQDGLTGAQDDAAKQAGKLRETAEGLNKQLRGLRESALTSGPAQKITTQLGPGGTLLGTTRTVDLKVAAQQAENLFDGIIRKSDDLTAAQKRTGYAVGALFNTIGRPPTPREIKIIVNDLVAKKSTAEIIRDLGWIGKQHPNPTVSMNKQPFDNGYDDVGRKAAALNRLHPDVHVGADTGTALAKLGSFKSTLAALAANPFTVHINAAPGKTGHFNSKGQWVYAAATGLAIAGRYDGIDNIPVVVGKGEAILNPTQIGMVDSGRYSVMGALRATGAPTIQRGGGYASGGLSVTAALSALNQSRKPYLTSLQQYQLDQAQLLDANGNPRDAATAERILKLEISNMDTSRAAAVRLKNYALASRIAQDEAGIQGQLQGLRSAAAAAVAPPADSGPPDDAGVTPGNTAPDQDLVAQLAQANSRILALTRGQGFAAAAQNAFDQGGLHVVSILGDGRSISAIATAAAKGFNAQPYIAQNAGSVYI